MKLRVARELRYRVMICRDPGETWPPLERGCALYDVTAVTVEVELGENGSFAARWPEVTEGRRIKADGTPGAAIGHARSRNVYSGENGDPAEEQAAAFRRAAVQMAHARHAAWLGDQRAELTCADHGDPPHRHDSDGEPCA